MQSTDIRAPFRDIDKLSLAAMKLLAPKKTSQNLVECGNVKADS